VSAWSLPTKGNDGKVKKVMLVSPNSSLLTGVAFLEANESALRIASVAYDSRYISMMQVD
jgi:CTP:phosphocholine cytidylyltransferase-like protein